MNQNIDLEKIEKKVYMAYHKDGLWDIALGTALAGFGFLMLFDKVAFMGALAVFLFFGAFGIKKSIILPRLGYVKFSPKRQQHEQQGKAKLSILLTITTIAGLVCFWAFMGNDDLQIWIRNLYLLPLGIVLSVVIGAVGVLYGLKRFIFYGVLILAIFILGHILNSEPPAYFIFLGIIFFITGLIMFARFIHNYPRQRENEAYNG